MKVICYVSIKSNVLMETAMANTLMRKIVILFMFYSIHSVGMHARNLSKCTSAFAKYRSASRIHFTFGDRVSFKPSGKEMTAGNKTDSERHQHDPKQILAMTNGVRKLDEVFSMGISNREDFGSALLRPGRLELNVDVSEEAIEEILNVCFNVPRGKTIAVINCPLQSEEPSFTNPAVNKALEIIKNNREKKLKLNYMNISSADGILLAEALSENTELEELYIFRNNLNDCGAIAFAQMLKVNKGLKKLWLSNNNITDVGAIEIAEALTYNDTLIELDLSANIIGIKGANAFKEIKLEHRNTTLTSLEIGDSNLLTSTQLWELNTRMSPFSCTIPSVEQYRKLREQSLRQSRERNCSCSF